MCTTALRTFWRTFLSNKSQKPEKVRVGKDWSTKADILSGIPQGSVLGLILFISFINDLPECVQSCCKVFADDTKIYCLKIQEDIYRLQEWSDMWNLYFNVIKCKVMHIGRRRR